MKNLAIVFLVSVLGIATYSCSQFDEDLSDNSIQQIECKGWNEIGQLHNDGLEMLFEKLRLEDRTTLDYKKSSQITQEVALSYYDEIQSNLNHPHYPISLELHKTIIQGSKDNVELFFDGSEEELLDLFTSSGAENEDANNIILILNIFENTEFNTSYEALKRELDNLKSSLEEQNKWNYILDDTYNVALATYCYWDSNMDKWLDEFSKPNSSLSRADRLIKTGRADLLGAGYGAIGGDGPGAVGGDLTASGLRLLATVFWG